jgi:hypothetical protein
MRRSAEPVPDSWSISGPIGGLGDFSKRGSIRGIRLESLSFSGNCFVEPRATKQFLRGMKPFPALAQTSGNSPWLTTVNERRTAPASKTGDSQMRTLTFILAVAFVVAGASIAGSSDTSLPGIGTFSYSGSPVAASAPETIVVAAR